MFLFTNGDAVADGLRQLGVTGQIFPWRDVLHEGPVPNLPLRELSALRASWLAAQDWGDGARIAKYFRQRDTALAKSRRHKRTELWFEHDLYDQLQLIQILGELAIRKAEPRRYEMVCIDSFPGFDGFRGLGQLSVDQLATLRDQLAPLTAEHLELAREAWEAFRAPDPTALVSLARALEASAPLPFLGAALRRWLAQFPEVGTGLDRVERWILEGVAERPRRVGELFVEVSRRDPAPFLADQPFSRYLSRLALGEPALVEVRDQEVPEPGTWARLTDAGRRCLDGELDLAVTQGWWRVLGGVELTAGSDGPAWRYDPETGTLLAVG